MRESLEQDVFGQRTQNPERMLARGHHVEPGLRSYADETEGTVARRGCEVFKGESKASAQL